MPRGTAVPLLTILTPCYNEEENVREVYERVKAAMATVPECDYEHLFADNASTDKTVHILRDLAGADRRVKVIVNTRNFGHIRSPYHAFLEARRRAGPRTTSSACTTWRCWASPTTPRSLCA